MDFLPWRRGSDVGAQSGVCGLGVKGWKYVHSFMLASVLDWHYST